MKNKTVYLYRQAGALGVATHYSYTRPTTPAFEYLGRGTMMQAGQVSTKVPIASLIKPLTI